MAWVFQIAHDCDFYISKLNYIKEHISKFLKKGLTDNLVGKWTWRNRHFRFCRALGDVFTETVFLKGKNIPLPTDIMFSFVNCERFSHLQSTNNDIIIIIIYICLLPFVDLFHWSCLNRYAISLPATTAPAGYQCPKCKGIFLVLFLLVFHTIERCFETPLMESLFTLHFTVLQPFILFSIWDLIYNKFWFSISATRPI